VPQNVVLIVFDTARADAFESYGAAPGASPALAQLASRGVAAPAARAAAIWTVPSHAAMFSGLLPRATGTSQPTGDNLPREYLSAMRSVSNRLLPEVLRGAGFRTGAVSTNLWLTPASGFGIGFERFENVATERQTRLDATSRRERLRWSMEAVRARADDGAREAERVLGGWMSEPRDRPSFWFVNLVECHSPYLPPKPYNDLGVGERLRAAEEARLYLNMLAIWRACLGGLQVPEPALERMRTLYARSISLLDDWLGRVLEALDRHGLLDDTLLIVTSDHGENIGESGLMGHAFSLDERLLRVPLVAAGPGSEELADVASLAELPARIARAIGLDNHPWNNGLPGVDGVTVAQFDPPAPRDHPKVRTAIADWGLSHEAELTLTGAQDCAIEGSLKLLVREGTERFFDLGADPLEQHELAPGTVPAEVADRLRRALADPAFTAGPHVRPDAGAPAPEQISDAERQQLEDSMRLLGYL
jgi:arylsulfatase A-like enzyme